MRMYSLAASACARNRKSRSRKRRSGFTTVVGTAILIAAVSILGSIMVIWANTTFNAHRQTIGNDYERNSNLLKERFIIEDVWLSKSPDLSNYVYVTINNIGDIAINVKEVKVTALDSNGNLTCTSSCESGTTASKTVVPTNGVIGTKTILRIDVGNIDWDNNNSKSLDISITTERGSIERVIWGVK